MVEPGKWFWSRGTGEGARTPEKGIRRRGNLVRIEGRPPPCMTAFSLSRFFLMRLCSCTVCDCSKTSSILISRILLKRSLFSSDSSDNCCTTNSSRRTPSTALKLHSFWLMPVQGGIRHKRTLAVYTLLPVQGGIGNISRSAIVAACVPEQSGVSPERESPSAFQARRAV